MKTKASHALAALVMTIAASPCGAVTFEVIHDFKSTDGAHPTSGVVLDGTGALYGTTETDGPNGHGTIYKFKDGHLTTLHAFSGGPNDGDAARGGLHIDSNGALVGTTLFGGPSNLGIVYRFSTASGLRVMHAFTGGLDGSTPLDGLTVGPDGTYYGSAPYGGLRSNCVAADGCGVTFSMDKHLKNFITLHAFTGAEGAYPAAAPTPRGGELLGGTMGGGAVDGGSPFAMATDGSTFHALPAASGALFEGGLRADADGVLWGVTGQGGAWGIGGIYRVERDDTVTWVYNFTGTFGGYANGRPVFDAAGNLYGTLPSRGGFTSGSVFRFVPGTGEFRIVYEFDGLSADSPTGDLAIDPAGRLYGTTEYAGAGNAGVIYRLVP